MHQIRFRAGLYLGPPLWELMTLPHPLVGWGGEYPLPHSHPLDAFGVSVSAPLDWTPALVKS